MITMRMMLLIAIIISRLLTTVGILVAVTIIPIMRMLLRSRRVLHRRLCLIIIGSWIDLGGYEYKDYSYDNLLTNYEII